MRNLDKGLCITAAGMLTLTAGQVVYAGGGVGESCTINGWIIYGPNCIPDSYLSNCFGQSCASPCGCTWSGTALQCDDQSEYNCANGCIDNAWYWQGEHSTSYPACG
jgi:hypothetical protein